MTQIMGFFIAPLIGFLHFSAVAGPIRSVESRTDSVTNINTALGIATIIQVPQTIQSMIIGDQAGFRVEYLDKAVTIKPLRWGAKTNLYLLTENQRFNLRLKTDRQESADFVVHIKPTEGQNEISWRTFHKAAGPKEGRQKGVSNPLAGGKQTLQLQKLGRSQAGFLILVGQISSHEYAQIKPNQFWIYQGKRSKIINTLYLSATKITSTQPVLFALSIAQSDLEPQIPITLELKAAPPLSIEIPKAVAWN